MGESALMNRLEFSVTWRPDDVRGAASVEPNDDEDTLGELRISVGGASLTRVTADDGVVLPGPRVPAARLAEWLIWHWWRLLWEPERDSIAWHRAHDMACVGGGWLWPNLSVNSDGCRICVDAKPSVSTEIEPLSHLVDAIGFVTQAEFERSVDAFIGSVLERLDARQHSRGHLGGMRQELMQDRMSSDATLHRKVEALLGCDPDEGDPSVIRQIIDGGRDLGLDAMAEVASDAPLSSEQVRQVAARHGMPCNPSDGIDRNDELMWDGTGRLAPWRVGVAAAHDLRSRQNLGDGPVDGQLLEELCGLATGAIQGGRRFRGMAFSLKTHGRQHSVVLNSGRRTSRRFAAARLLGDRLLVDSDESLRPSTRSRTYRQQMQRAFSAEFLCPLESLKAELQGDYSGDRMEKVAGRFAVSPWLVHAQLANDGLTIVGDGMRARSVVLAA